MSYWVIEKTGNIDGVEGENQTRYQGIKPLQCQESLDAGVFRRR